MADYSDILNKQWDEIPEPQVLPEGSYLLKTRSASFQPAKDADSNPTVLFAYNVKQPMDDVPEDELAKLGEYDFSINTVYSRFWIENDADWAKVKKHLKKHGIDTSGMSISEALKEVRGSEVVAFLKQRSFTNNAGETVEENQPVNFVEVE